MFTNPIALAALSLLVLPVLIHTLARLKGRRVLFPTIRYLDAAESHRLSARKVERWPLLALRLLACAFLILAVTGPVLLKESYDSRAVLLMIDSSLSMSAGPVREQVARHAREVIDSLAARDVAAIAQCDDRVKLLCEFTADRALLEAALDAYDPAHRAVDFNAALLWANEKLAARRARRELIILSDLQATGVQSLRPAQLNRIALQVIKLDGGFSSNARLGPVVARPRANALDVSSTLMFDEGDRTTIAPIEIKLSTGASNVSATSSSANATLSAKPLSRELLGGMITVSRADEFSADDHRFFVARVADEDGVMIIQPRFTAGDQAAFIEKAIQANSIDDSKVKPTRRGEQFPTTGDAMAGSRIVIAPVESLNKANVVTAREYARRGGSLILTVNAASNISHALEIMNGPDGLFQSLSLDPITSLDSVALNAPASLSDSTAGAQSPSFEAGASAAFASARLHSAHAVKAAGAETLMKYSNGEPAIARLDAGAGKVLISGFGLSVRDSTLPLSPVFPLFIAWLIEAAGVNPAMGDFVVGQTPAGLLREATKVRVVYSSKGPASDEIIIDQASELDAPGVYEVERLAGKTFFSLNPPIAESSLARASEDDLLGRVSIIEGGKSGPAKYEGDDVEKGDELWMIFAVAALLLSAFELLYSNLKTVKGGK